MNNSDIYITAVSQFAMSLLVGFGAIGLIKKMVAERVGKLHGIRIKIVPAGGVALLSGIALSCFYFFDNPPASAYALLAATFFAMALSATSKLIAARLRIDPVLLVMFRVLGMMAIVVGLLMPDFLLSNASALPTWLVIGMFTLLPIAMVRMGHLTEAVAPRRTSLLFLLMLAGMLLLGLHDDFNGADAATRFNWEIVLPILGSLTAVLIHMTDWGKLKHDTVLGEGGNLILGLALGWKALQLAAESPRPGITIVTLSMIVCSPLFAAMARAVFDRMRPPAQAGHRVSVSPDAPKAHARFEYLSTVLLIASGLAFSWSGIHWSFGLILMLVSFFLYLYGLAFTDSRLPVADNSPHRASLKAFIGRDATSKP